MAVVCYFSTILNPISGAAGVAIYIIFFNLSFSLCVRYGYGTIRDIVT